MQYGRFAELYDGFMDNVDYGAWAGYLTGLMEQVGGIVGRPPKRVHECGCGTGSLTIPLKKAGFDITASDISEEMLAVASEKARRAGQRIVFSRMDMRRFSLARPVDAVLACCDAVNYLSGADDALRFFSAARAALDQSGMLLFDISSEYKLKNVLGNNCFSDSRRDRAYFWRNTFDDKTRLIRMELEFFTERGGGLYERFSETHIQRAHALEELTELLKKAGFETVLVFDAFTLDPPKPDSERLQFAAFGKNQ
ncbi:MAG: methyltransferase domain-containing protein [Clostridia bacterium]|nr:methyltransferase domain-containing protein [Clostridia bacterium]